MKENSEPSAKSDPKTALILPVFSEDDTYHPGQFSWPDTGGAHWLAHDLFFQSLLGEVPQTETYNGEELSEILAGGENAIICSRICGSVANAIGEFAGRSILEGRRVLKMWSMTTYPNVTARYAPSRIGASSYVSVQIRLVTALKAGRNAPMPISCQYWSGLFRFRRVVPM